MMFFGRIIFEHLEMFILYFFVNVMSFKMFLFLQTYLYIFKNITVSVPGAIITGAVCILLLTALKFVSEKLKHRMKFPLPAELIVVSEDLLIHESCYFLSGFKNNYNPCAIKTIYSM